MKRGQKPSRHVRVVRTRKGMKAVSVNPMISKKMTNKQYRKVWPKMMPRADYDGDGVPNYKDCKPFDKKKQDSRKVITGGDNAGNWWFRGQNVGYEEYMARKYGFKPDEYSTSLKKDEVRKMAPGASDEELKQFED
jgi:hypothetical protein